MSKTASRKTEDAILTVGELISELCRWPDHAAVAFRCQHHELRFTRIKGRSKAFIDIELGPAPERAPAVAA